MVGKGKWAFVGHGIINMDIGQVLPTLNYQIKKKNRSFNFKQLNAVKIGYLTWPVGEIVYTRIHRIRLRL